MNLRRRIGLLLLAACVFVLPAAPMVHAGGGSSPTLVAGENPVQIYNPSRTACSVKLTFYAGDPHSTSFSVHAGSTYKYTYGYPATEWTVKCGDASKTGQIPIDSYNFCKTSCGKGCSTEKFLCAMDMSVQPGPSQPAVDYHIYNKN